MENNKTNWNKFLKLMALHLALAPSVLSQSVPEIVFFKNQEKFRIYKKLSTITGSICRSKQQSY